MLTAPSERMRIPKRDFSGMDFKKAMAMSVVGQSSRKLLKKPKIKHDHVANAMDFDGRLSRIASRIRPHEKRHI